MLGYLSPEVKEDPGRQDDEADNHRSFSKVKNLESTKGQIVYLSLWSVTDTQVFFPRANVAIGDM